MGLELRTRSPRRRGRLRLGLLGLAGVAVVVLAATLSSGAGARSVDIGSRPRTSTSSSLRTRSRSANRSRSKASSTRQRPPATRDHRRQRGDPSIFGPGLHARGYGCRQAAERQSRRVRLQRDAADPAAVLVPRRLRGRRNDNDGDDDVGVNAFQQTSSTCVTVGSKPDLSGATVTGKVKVDGRSFREGVIKYGARMEVADGSTLNLGSNVGHVSLVPTGSSATIVASRSTIPAPTATNKHRRRPIVDLRLVGGDFSRCGNTAFRSLAAATKTKKPTRSLWGQGKGHYRTTGNFSSATVRGTVMAGARHVRGHADEGVQGCRRGDGLHHPQDRDREGGALVPRQAASGLIGPRPAKTAGRIPRGTVVEASIPAYRSVVGVEGGKTMRRFVRFKPSPSLVIASVALLAALGGTSIAAVNAVVPNNSVGTPQLKNNAVTSLKVANRSLKSIDFALGQIPKGPAGPAGPAGAAGPAGSCWSCRPGGRDGVRRAAPEREDAHRELRRQGVRAGGWSGPADPDLVRVPARQRADVALHRLRCERRAELPGEREQPTGGAGSPLRLRGRSGAQLHRPGLRSDRRSQRHGEQVRRRRRRDRDGGR